MNTRLILAFIALSLAPVLPAQVPQLINYQGRVAVNGTNFDGNGQFKFALVDATGSTTYWSNDSSSTAGSEPTAAVAITVTKGLYSVLLGDATQPHMTIVSATVFTHADVHLRVWFNDGSNGFQLLAPDKRIAAVGYALMADSVSEGAITTAKLADGAVTSAKLAPGAIGSANLAPGAAAANLTASGQVSLPSGGVLFSSNEDDANLASAGYVKLGRADMGNQWESKAPSLPPSKRSRHSAIWTGIEMITWGGNSGSGVLGDGSRYNPSTNTWQAMSTIDAPSAREGNTAVWTGSEMIIWGGSPGGGALGDGARYNPTTDTWTTMSFGAAARVKHTSVWTGSEMIVWGGNNGSTDMSNGSRYNPASDSWLPLNSTNAPSGRTEHSAVWTGTEMIVWGGSVFPTGGTNTGAIYNPTTDSWRAVTSQTAPSARSGHTAIWTGTAMIIWGGGRLNDGGRYDPVNDAWTLMATSGAPSGRYGHTAVWTGSEMIVWGGIYSDFIGNNSYLGDGGRFNPVKDAWALLSNANAPKARWSHTALWTGGEMLVWGGRDGTTAFSDIYGHSVGRVLYLYQRQ